MERVSVLMDRSIVMGDRLRDLMASGESEFGRRVDMMEETMARQIREENRQSLERAQAEVERCRMMMENEGVQRQEDLDKVGKGVREGIASLEAKILGAPTESVENVERVSVLVDRTIVMEDRLRDLATSEGDEFSRKLEMMEERKELICS